MTTTQQQIDAVRQVMPNLTDMQINRHLQQRARLSQLAEQQRRQRLAECLDVHYEVRQ